MCKDNFYKNAISLIGNTPLVRLTAIEKELCLKGKIFAKVEGFNPTGSVKDRTAKGLIDDAVSSGKLKAGGTIIEPTSGNTGIGLAMICSQLGYNAIIVMPDSMSVERRRLMTSYGASLVLTPGKDGMGGAIKKAEELAREIPNSFIPNQFSNPANALAHYQTTAVEIYKALNGKIDAFVTGVGTGGTFTGIARYLKERIPSVYNAVVEPASSAVLSGLPAGGHAIQGIGAGFIPSVLDQSLIENVFTCPDCEAFKLAKLIIKREGISVGISSGASLYGAIMLAKMDEFKGKNIVTVFPDNSSKYMSTALFED